MGVADQDADVDTMLKDIKGRLDNLPGKPLEASGCTIFRVPPHIRHSHKGLYEPMVISIGPYHHGRKDLRAMEEHKWQYLRDFLSRHPDATFLKTCIEQIKALEFQARRCYFESFDLDSREFTETMLLDGCFMLEFFLKRINGEVDSVIEVTWNWNLIKNDLLMLENQIPFFLLQELFKLFLGSETSTGASKKFKLRRTTSSISKHSEDILVEILIQYLMWGEMKSVAPITGKEIHHLLHLYHLCFVPTPTPTPSKHKQRSLLNLLKISTPETLTTNKRAPGSIPCASKLLESGITLKKKSTFNFLDVTFEGGVLEIPFISIGEMTKSRFMNLVALEQCSKMERNMASYAAFMDCLINTPKDVAVLQECGIIDNVLANNEEAALFLNQLADCAAVNYENHYLAELFTEVNAYCQSNWNRWRAKLKGEYFHSPWAILSLVAAFILLVLTFLQTFLAVYSFYHPLS